MKKAKRDAAVAAGECPTCADPLAPGRKWCTGCLADRAEQARGRYRAKKPEVYACSYCNELGHNRRTCEQYREASRKHGEVAALMHAQALQPITEKNPFAWEVQAQHRAKLRQVFEYIATLPPSKSSAELASKAAKAALRFV